jgi:arylsulfatase A-like enzyme
MKRDNWEGGHRVPLIVQWKDNVKPGATCSEPVCLSDFMATCAELTGQKLPKNAGEDSYSLLKALIGERYEEPLRPPIIHNAFTGERGVRSGDWKLLDHQGAGSHNYTNRPIQPPISDPDAPGQLYNLKNDLGERKNLYRMHPNIVRSLKKRLEESGANRLPSNQPTPFSPEGP